MRYREIIIEAEEPAINRKWIDNPFFRKWFAGSKIVDTNSNPMLVFHGSPTPIESFVATDVGGFFFTDDHNYAASHLVQNKGVDSGYLNPSFLSIKNPQEITPPRKEWSVLSDERRYIQQAKEQGHDGLILHGPSTTFYVAFYPSQIKSFHNSGRFSAVSNDVMECFDNSNEPSLPEFDLPQ